MDFTIALLIVTHLASATIATHASATYVRGVPILRQNGAGNMVRSWPLANGHIPDVPFCLKICNGTHIGCNSWNASGSAGSGQLQPFTSAGTFENSSRTMIFRLFAKIDTMF